MRRYAHLLTELRPEARIDTTFRVSGAAAAPEVRNRFLKEARTAAKLSHPNIVPIFSVEQAGDFVPLMATLARDLTARLIVIVGLVPDDDTARSTRHLTNDRTENRVRLEAGAPERGHGGDEEGESQIKTAIPYKPGDRVRVKEGYFQNFEGDIDAIDESNGRITVMINIFGRATPVELDHWQVEDV